MGAPFVAAASAADQIPTLHAVVLGVVQGLSEFLPISSSGHLVLTRWAFGWELTGPAANDLEKTFDVALHLGTFVGAGAYFAKDIAGLAASAWRSLRRRSVRTREERRPWLLLLSAIPAAVVGATLERVIEDELGEVWLIAVLLIVFGGVLASADRSPTRRGEDGYGLREALVMGVAQAAALAPGVSRSGITMSAGRWLGFDRDAAARLSFLMSLPVIGGAGIYEGAKLLAGEGLPPGMAGAFVWGMAASAVTGAAAVWAVLRLVRTRSFTPFVVYRVATGAVVLLVLVTGLR